MRIRAATLNVWALPGPLAQDVARRIKAIGERVAALELDVVAFQEVFRSDAREVLVAAGRRAGLINSSHQGSGVPGGGLLTLSRLPIEAAHFERYSLRGHAEEVQTGEYLSGKGFGELQLRTSEGPITFINTHLHARYEKDFDHEFKAQRMAQIVQLSSSSAFTPHPVIAAGDFNFAEDQIGYSVFTGLTGLRDAAAELDLRAPTVELSNPYRRRQQRPKRIDYVFHRDGVSRSVKARDVVRVFDDPLPIRSRLRACSNHWGVLAEFDIEPRIETPLPAPLAWALGEASRLLAQGRTAAEQRRRKLRGLSGVGLASMLAATAGGRSPVVSRRKLLRLSLRGAALLALTPTLGYSMLSEIFVPTEIHAFKDAEAQLAKLGREVGLLHS